MPFSPPHIIRLRGPWQLIPLDRPDAQPVGGRIGRPWDCFLGDYDGPVLYVRHFNRPTGLGPADRVQLAILDYIGAVQVSLNDQAPVRFVAAEVPIRIDITRHLQPNNRLAIQISPPALPCPAGITGEVQLEIFEATGG